MFGLIRKQKLKHVLERIVSENCDYAPSPPNANINDWQNFKWGNLSCVSYISRMFNIQIDVANINNQVFNRRIKEKHDNELSKLRSPD